jgi:crotonobetainyl-CoA:carnitine CoA-transferase CaiB-like acyl-CoA transferase
VVENFLPGTLDPHGLAPGQLRRAFPDLVVCSITGYGQDGPYASLPGYDAVLQGFTGLMSITGSDDGPPTKVGVAIVDVMTGAHAAAATLAAMLAVARGGGGAHIDIALYEVGVASLVNVAQSALATGQPARRHGNAHPQIVPYQTFAAADAPLVVAVGNDGQWRRLCATLELPELPDDPRFASNAERVLHRSDLLPMLAERIATRPRDAWLARLREARVPAGPVRDVVAAVQDPAFQQRKMVAEASGEFSTPLLRLPWCVDGGRAAVRRRPPRLGEHTAEFRARFGS